MAASVPCRTLSPGQENLAVSLYVIYKFILQCIMHPQEILVLCHSLSFIHSQDFLGSVPLYIMHAFTGDSGFVSQCIMHPQEMFYWTSCVCSQEVLALFYCILYTLGKHFTS